MYNCKLLGLAEYLIIVQANVPQHKTLKQEQYRPENPTPLLYKCRSLSLPNVAGPTATGEELCEVETFITELMKKKFRLNHAANHNRHVITELMKNEQGQR